MKIDKMLLEKAKQEYHKMYNKGTKWDSDTFDWCVSKIGGIVELENGMLFVIDKPSVQKDFCFGYGQNGVADEKSFKSANDACDEIQKKQGFLNANLAEFDREHNYLFLGKQLFFFRLSRNSRCNPVNIVKISDRAYTYYHQDGFVSENDRGKICNEIGRMRDEFKKRLEAYWKRYGATKLKTWTYLVD